MNKKNKINEEIERLQGELAEHLAALQVIKSESSVFATLEREIERIEEELLPLVHEQEKKMVKRSTECTLFVLFAEGTNENGKVLQYGTSFEAQSDREAVNTAGFLLAKWSADFAIVSGVECVRLAEKESQRIVNIAETV